MRATEMHDLLIQAHDALNVDVFQPGKFPGFGNINYCRYCHYSEAHGHGDTCILRQLKRIADSAEPNGGAEHGK